MGVIYLLHFQRSYCHARHYLGYTDNLDARLAAHRAGRGSPLVAAAIADGIEFELAATWAGDRHRERQLHRYHNTPRRLCPICRAGHQPPAADPPGKVDHADELLVSTLTDLSEPVTLPALRRRLQRQTGARVGSLHCRLELLALAGRVRKTQLLGEIAWTADGACRLLPDGGTPWRACSGQRNRSPRQLGAGREQPTGGVR